MEEKVNPQKGTEQMIWRMICRIAGNGLFGLATYFAFTWIGFIAQGALINAREVIHPIIALDIGPVSFRAAALVFLGLTLRDLANWPQQ
ncbi:MAG: hypothetical protein ABSA49_03170 [Rhizomicrobium sp.]